MTVHASVTWLFVPGSREDRFERAAGAGADEVILDLEDAVAPDTKDEARDRVASWLDGARTGWVRVNGTGTPWHELDLAAVGTRPGLLGVVVPKAEDPSSLLDLRERLPAGVSVVALVESARGIDRATAIAASGAVDRLAFGSVDFSLDIGAEDSDQAMLFARSSLVIASRVASLPPPLDGVTVSTTDEAESRAAAARARGLGFGGKLCIHPRQVQPVAEGFRPTAAQLAWASRVLGAAGPGPAGTPDQGAFSVDGQMVDLPVLARARSIVARAGLGVPE
jgi:citrate lyase subunit beta/citryl-CoA lyase